MKQDLLIEKACTGNDVTLEQLKSRSRLRKLCYLRYILWKALYVPYSPEYNTAKLGGLFGRDHALVLHGLQKFEELKDYEDFRLLIENSGLTL